MPQMTQYNYLMAIGTIFSLLDAYNIGANDVANSWATSVSSRSVTMRQAMLGAAVMEFLGAVTVGARVADTIKNGIIPRTVFQNNPGVQLLAFTCAITVSGSWLMFCSYMSFPVSTTYSIVSAVAGTGVALGGGNAVVWGWNNGKGLAAIFAGLLLAPALAGGFGATLYLIVKFGVLSRKNNIRWALYTGPAFFMLAACVCTMSIIYKGAPSLGLDEMSQTKTALAIVLTGLVVAMFAFLFWVPYVHAKVIKKDYTLRWYHFFMGPLLWKRQAPLDAHDQVSAVPDYRVVQTPEGEVVAVAAPNSSGSSGVSVEGADKIYPTEDAEKQAIADAPTVPAAKAAPRHKSSLLSRQMETLDRHPLEEGDWYSLNNLRIYFKYRMIPKLITTFSYGMEYDIHGAQQGAADTPEGRKMANVYAQAKQYPNEVEHCYSFIQVLTACTASFAHGANDVSNAIGPWTVIYQVWSTGDVQASKAAVPIWILIVGALMIVLGLATYGYNIMRVLGNKITYHSPSRGTSMEMGAAITVILASQFGLPVSTTMCITGATLGVGLCNGNIHAINWKATAWIFTGWVLTIPVVGTLAGCLCGMFLNAPHF